MAKLLSDLQAVTRQYLDEASALNWTNTDVNYDINFSYHWLIGKVINVYEKFYETTSAFNYAIVANQQEYAIDSSLIKVTRVEIDYNNGGSETKAARAVPVNSDEIRGNLGNQNNAGSFFAAGYYLHGNIGSQNIGFIPIPSTGDSGANKSIWVWGIQMPGDLVNTTDNVNIPYADNFSQIICKRAAGQLLRKGQQEEAAGARYIAEATIEATEMQEFLKDRIGDDGTYIIDSAIEQIDFSTLEII